MKFGFKHVAVAAILAIGGISTTPATVQAQLSPAVQAQVNLALAAGDTATVLVALKTLMDANPLLIAQIAVLAGNGNTNLVAAIGGQAATALAASGLPAGDQAAQMTAASTGLAAANPGQALAIFQTVQAAVPTLAVAAGTGVSDAPGVSSDVADTIVAINTDTAAGNDGGDGGDGDGGDADGDADAGDPINENQIIADSGS